MKARAGERESGKQESRKPGVCPVPFLFFRSMGSNDRMTLRCSTGPRSAGIASCPAPTDLLAACPVRLAETAAQLREIGPPLPIAPVHRFPIAPAKGRCWPPVNHPRNRSAHTASLLRRPRGARNAKVVPAPSIEIDRFAHERALHATGLMRLSGGDRWCWSFSGQSFRPRSERTARRPLSA